MELIKRLDLRHGGLIMILSTEIISLVAIGGAWGWWRALAVLVAGGLLFYLAHERPTPVPLIFALVALVLIPHVGIRTTYLTAGLLFAGLLVIFFGLSFGITIYAFITR